MVFYNGRIVREDRVIEKGSVRVEDGKIVDIRETDEGKSIGSTYMIGGGANLSKESENVYVKIT